MASEASLSFDDLVEHRRGLQEFCETQFGSTIAFKDGPSFKVYLDDGACDPASAHHLSSSATCYESALDCPRKFVPESQSNLAVDAATFAKLSLKRLPDDWTSDGSAPIYCRCRTLPLVIKFTESSVNKLAKHVESVLKQLSDNNRLAIGEASGSNQRDWYPPNAYHTYWTLVILEAFQSKFWDAYNKIEPSVEGASLQRLRAEMLLWAREAAAFQVGLHSVDSPALDSDQLAWAMAVLFRFGTGFEVDIGEQDFIRAALECLFARQNSVGVWRTGRPLFHYKKSGNAHCYVFETFTVLLKAVLTTREGTVFLRQALQPYARNLFKLYNYAISTRIPLIKNSKIFGWSSGHRPNRKEAESWATASVYSYVNCLRRLVGIWTREVATRELGVASERGSKKKGIEKIIDRGDTWSRGPNTAAMQLMTLFVNPIISREAVDPLEPDNEPIREEQSRGAILFGPPGTSKTTLSRSVARAIGWDYIELHASHFVASGLPEVQRTADRIFKQLMQLDRTVILFDEIDELVRERESEEADTFGRFLTTSMLPRLAELWKRRKVIYFVATNHINYFDSAIIRAERFDAIIPVAPPSFDKKIERLTVLLNRRGLDIKIDIDRKSVDESVNDLTNRANRRDSSGSGEALPEQCTLAKFLLIRWDQLDELAARLAKLLEGAKRDRIDNDLFKKALQSIADPFLDNTEPFLRYLMSERYERRDFSKSVVWEIIPGDSTMNDTRIRREQDRFWFDDFDLHGLSPDFRLVKPGSVEIRSAASLSKRQRERRGQSVIPRKGIPRKGVRL